MTRDRYFKPGDNYLTDDITGLKIRASEADTQWDGAVTARQNINPRHPQDFVRAVPDGAAVFHEAPVGAGAQRRSGEGAY